MDTVFCTFAVAYIIGVFLWVLNAYTGGEL